MKKEITKIIENSICNIVCIDDEYISPYDSMLTEDSSSDEERILKEKRRESSEKMYDKISRCGVKNVSLIPYTKSTDKVALSNIFTNKDLLILDWDLGTQTYRDALLILDEAISSNLEYICIYTHEKHIDKISRAIKTYYSYSKKEVLESKENAEKAGIIVEEFMDLVQEFYESRNNSLGKIKRKIEEDGFVIDDKLFPHTDKIAWKKLYLAWNNVPVVEDDERKLEVVDVLSDTFKVKDKYIIIFKKEVQETNDEDNNSIGADEIIDRIAEMISDLPSGPINGIWLHFTNLIRDNLNNSGDYFEDINWEAFAYYANKLYRDYGVFEMNTFLKRMFSRLILQKVDADAKGDLPERIIEEIQKSGNTAEPATIKNELAKLNRFLNIDYWKSISTHALTFGDVLWDIDEQRFYLCITALCDCAIRENSKNEEDRIKQNFIFISEGTKTNQITTDLLANVEGDYYSFVSLDINDNKDVYAIKWNCKNLHSFKFKATKTFVPSENEMMANIGGKCSRLKYICNVSTEYAQRMANEAFSISNRVGVSFANTHK